jgi:hypothetical protein
MNTQPRTLDDFGDNAVWLESVLTADRWQIGEDGNGDSVSAWFCSDCGSLLDATEDGCHACGRGVELEPEEEAREWA